MILQCPSVNARVFDPLDMEWDPVAGTLTGDGAAYVKNLIALNRFVYLHPIPRGAHELSAEPLKSYVDMAAIVGRNHILPDILAPHYPYLDGDDDDVDEDGNVYGFADGEHIDY